MTSPPSIRGHHTPVLDHAGDETLRGWASRYARAVFVQCRGNKRQTCRRLGISYHTLDAYLRYANRRRGGRRQMPAWVTKSYLEEQEEPAGLARAAEGGSGDVRGSGD